MTYEATTLTDFSLEKSRDNSGSWTVFSDQILSFQAEAQDERELLIEFVRSGRVFEYAQGTHGEMPNSDSIESAVSFIKGLPRKCELPKVSSDGEGDLLLVWEAETNLLVTVEGNLLHVVTNPGELNSNHIDSVLFQNGVIPSEVAEVLPCR